MDGFGTVLLLALVPALGTFGGGLIAEFVSITPRRISQALHAAAGIVIAVVAVELMPAALGGAPGWAIALAFGGVFYLVIEWAIERVQRGRGASKSSQMWMVYVAVAMDLFSDGLLIGTGSAVSTSPGARARPWSNHRGYSRRLRCHSELQIEAGASNEANLALGFVRPAGALSGRHWLLVAARSKPGAEAVGGCLHRRSALAFAGGFALFALVSSYFE